MRGHAVVSPEKGKIELQECSVVDPGEKEIQVKIHASLISPGTERAMILNLSNTPGQYPFESGYCAAGVVEKTGSGVTEFSEGDRVGCFLIPHRSIGNVDENWAVKIPDGITFEDAAFLPLGQIALQGIRKARIELGEDVLILGLGIIGQLSVQFASLNGSMTVIGVDLKDNRLKLALENGADRVINSSEENWIETLEEKPQVVIESTGMPEAVSLAFQAADGFGRVILLGSTRGESNVNFYRDVHRPALTVIGAHAMMGIPKLESRPGFWTWKDDASCFMKYLKKQDIKTSKLVTNRVDWQEIEDIYKEILVWNPEIIGCIIKWQ